MKERAQTVLDEETNNTPFNQRYSQTQIDDLLHELQTTLINRVSASREINDKAQEMTDAVYDSTELTTEEKDTLVDQIENHKMKFLITLMMNLQMMVLKESKRLDYIL